MKTKVLTVLSLVLFVVTGFVAAAAESKRPAAPVKVRDREARTVRPTVRGRDQVVNREQMYREMIAKRNEAHRAAMKELEDIKKLADEEGATKTAEALQKMIDKKNDEFKKTMERFNQARRDRADQIQPRERAEKAKTVTAEQKEKADKEKAGD